MQIPTHPHAHSQNKAPPHVEGELLKQNSKAIVGKKGWRKYFFIVSWQEVIQTHKLRNPVLTVAMALTSPCTSSLVPRPFRTGPGNEATVPGVVMRPHGVLIMSWLCIVDGWLHLRRPFSRDNCQWIWRSLQSQYVLQIG